MKSVVGPGSGYEVAGYDRLRSRLADAGLVIRPDDLFPGRRRFYVDVPLGNRIEVLEST